ncbi:MAG: hypothetical protein Q3993_06555 [Filifactor alocis]|nr:hypothetical protein [Filifactor alocis]
MSRKIILLKESGIGEEKRHSELFSDGENQILSFDITAELYRCLEENVMPVETEDADFLEDIITELKGCDDVWHAKRDERLLKEFVKMNDSCSPLSIESKSYESRVPPDETNLYSHSKDSTIDEELPLREGTVSRYKAEEEFEHEEEKGLDTEFYNEIKETFGYNMKHELHWLLIAFVPWILFWLDRLDYISIDIRISLFVSLLILVIRLFKRKETWLDIASPIFFLAVFLMSSAVPMWVDYLSGVLSSVYLALVWALTILQGRPLTTEYTRIISNDSPHFIKSNENLTFMWVINFIVQGAMFFLNVNSPIYLFVLFPSAIVTFIYYRKHRSKNKQRNIHPLAR